MNKLTSVPIYASKTVWFNVLTGAVAIAGVVPHPAAIAISTIGNLALRVFFTSKPITTLGGPGTNKPELTVSG